MTTLAPCLRVARPARDIEATSRFYTQGLGLDLLARFDDHAGFDGVILGHAEWPYHMEFTRQRTHPHSPRPSEEDLLVFYFPESAEWNATVQRLHAFGANTVPSSNPYWDESGLTFEDPDGYRLVVQHAAWP